MSRKSSPRPSDRICTNIEHEIATGVYSDGDKLNEAVLAAQFSVSRTPLREAFQQLSASGLVELIPNRGAFVRVPSMTRLIEMFEVMAELEAWCTRLATRRITPAQRLHLQAAAADCKIALEAGQPQAYYAANTRLHGVIYEASCNQVLAEETQRMHQRLRPFRRSQLDVIGRLKASMHEHDGILAAIDDGDADRAADLMRAHINTSNRSYDQFRETLTRASER